MLKIDGKVDNAREQLHYEQYAQSYTFEFIEGIEAAEYAVANCGRDYDLVRISHQALMQVGGYNGLDIDEMEATYLGIKVGVDYALLRILGVNHK